LLGYDCRFGKNETMARTSSSVLTYRATQINPKTKHEGSHYGSLFRSAQSYHGHVAHKLNCLEAQHRNPVVSSGWLLEPEKSLR